MSFFFCVMGLMRYSIIYALILEICVLMANQRKLDLGVIFIDLFWKFLALFF